MNFRKRDVLFISMIIILSASANYLELFGPLMGGYLSTGIAFLAAFIYGRRGTIVFALLSIPSIVYAIYSVSILGFDWVRLPLFLHGLMRLGYLALAVVIGEWSDREKRNKKRINDELIIAKRVQKSIIPTNESLKCYAEKSLSISGLYEPMEELGGDYYDVLTLDYDHVMFVVADVSGHGVSAALLTTMGKVSFNMNSRNATNPADICTAVNRGISSDDHYLTAFCAILNTSTGKLEYTSCQHPPALLIRANGESVQLHNNNLAIGLMQNIDYISNEIYLTPGDRLILYTDGIIETRNKKGLMYDLTRLNRIANSTLDQNPDNTISAIINDVNQHSNHKPPEDDRVIICIDYKKQSIKEGGIKC